MPTKQRQRVQSLPTLLLSALAVSASSAAIVRSQELRTDARQLAAEILRRRVYGGV